MATSFSSRHIGQGNVGVQLLVQDHKDALEDGLEEAAKMVEELAIRYMPAHDPVRDPDPAMNLAERIDIRRDALHRLRVVVDTPYAAKQHEAMHFNHPRGGGPKYLEKALTEVIPLLPGIIASKVRARMKKRYTAR